jgi:Bacterial Ig-like domain (group 3)
VSSNLKVVFGQAVTFTVTVTPSGAATPSGAVQLYDNGQPYGSAANVSAGIATFFSTNLPVGVHSITADYRGDVNTLSSTSAPIMQVITGTTALQVSGTANGITETADVTVMVN